MATSGGRADRFRRLERDRYDVIVVGAGTGGLVAAALLARRGSSVLVLDQHYVAGGNATVFRRRGYEFDVGLHYIGQCGPNGMLPRILDAAGAGDVEFAPLDPDGFDTLVYPGLEFRVPQGIARYRDRLVEHFPSEKKGIDRYVRLLEQVALLQRVVTAQRSAIAALPRSLLALRYADGTLERFLDTCTRDPLLRAVLAAENGDYGQPPSRASLFLHAALMLHYLDEGAFYPVGGGQVMSDRLAESIEAAGGKILLRARVTRILVEGGRAAGVELENKHTGRRVVHADTVIANSDIKRTLLELVEPGALKARTRKRVRGWEMSPALGVLYLGARRDAFAHRGANTNYWIFGDTDLERLYADAAAGRFSEDPMAYVSIASRKDPTNRRLAPDGVVNLQVMTIVPSSAAAWGVADEEAASGAYSDSDAYRARKAALQASLIESAQRVLPRLGKNVVFSELSSPLTHSRYTLSTGGTSYGIASTPEQFLHRRPGPRSEIDGLVLCGASLRTGHGIVGAMMSGVMAAAAVAGKGVLRDALSSRVASLPRDRVPPLAPAPDPA